MLKNNDAPVIVMESNVSVRKHKSRLKKVHGNKNDEEDVIRLWE